MRPGAPAILAAALFICGCGGGPKLTAHAKFVARSDAICARAKKLSKSANHRSNIDPGFESPSALEWETFSSILANAGRELGGVVAPASEREAYVRFVTATRHEALLLGQLAKERRRLAAAQQRDEGSSNLLGTQNYTVREMVANAMNKRGRALGLTKCD